MDQVLGPVKVHRKCHVGVGHGLHRAVDQRLIEVQDEADGGDVGGVPVARREGLRAPRPARGDGQPVRRQAPDEEVGVEVLLVVLLVTLRVLGGVRRGVGVRGHGAIVPRVAGWVLRARLGHGDVPVPVSVPASVPVRVLGPRGFGALQGGRVVVVRRRRGGGRRGGARVRGRLGLGGAAGREGGAGRGTGRRPPAPLPAGLGGELEGGGAAPATAARKPLSRVSPPEHRRRGRAGIGRHC